MYGHGPAASGKLFVRFVKADKSRHTVWYRARARSTQRSCLTPLQSGIVWYRARARSTQVVQTTAKALAARFGIARVHEVRRYQLPELQWDTLFGIVRVHEGKYRILLSMVASSSCLVSCVCTKGSTAPGAPLPPCAQWVQRLRGKTLLADAGGGGIRSYWSSSSFRTAMKASGETCTEPSWRIFFFPSFCFSSSFFFLVMSPP